MNEAADTEARKRMCAQDPRSAVPPMRMSPRCEANGCSLAGVLSNLGGSGGHWCVYHYGAPAHDIPRITNVLAQHMALVDTITEGRNALANGEVAPQSVTDLWRNARDRLDNLGYEVPPPRDIEDDYGAWLYRVEMLLGSNVLVVRSLRRSSV